MSQKTVKNIAASVRRRLLNRAREEKRPFNELLQYYAMERFLYRLSESPFSEKFILKGAMMLRVWDSSEIRPTMDIDLLGRTSNDDENIRAYVRNILAVEVEPDGMIFDRDTIEAEILKEDADYEGVRIRFCAMLDSARVNLQIDIGFGDIIFPGPERSVLPSMLDFPSPRLLCYSRESSIAEKFEAMLKLRELNSRMKDFYDIWLFSRQFDFENIKLAEAIRLTLKQRKTELSDDITAFSYGFIEIKQVQWAAFRKRLKQEPLPEDFSEIVSAIKEFLSPVLTILHTGISTPSRWIAPGPWL